MRRRRIVETVVAVFLLSGPARADEPIEVLLLALPADADALGTAVQAERAIRTELRRLSGYDVDASDQRLYGTHRAATERLTATLRKLAAARTSYDQMDLGTALERLREVSTELEGMLADLESIEPYGFSLLYEAAAFVLNGQTREGVARLTRLQSIAPQIRPDPDVFPPDVVSRYQQITNRAGRLERATLVVEAEPAGAEVYVDGTLRGRSPVRVERLSPGDHVVRIRQIGYRTHAEIATLGARSERRLAPSLTELEQALPLREALSGLSTHRPDPQTPSAEVRAIVQALGSKVGAQRLVIAHASSGATPEVAVEIWRLPEGERLALEQAPASEDGAAAVAVRIFGRALTTSRNVLAVRSEASSLPVAPAPSMSILKRWWFWGAVGAVVVTGLIAGIAIAATPGANQSGEIVLQF